MDRIEGLCPAIAIDQKTVGHNPRSTVGTILRKFMIICGYCFRIGTLMCPDCGITISAEQPDKIAALLKNQFLGNSIIIAAPIAMQKRGSLCMSLKNFSLPATIAILLMGSAMPLNGSKKFIFLNSRKQNGIRLISSWTL